MADEEEALALPYEKLVNLHRMAWEFTREIFHDDRDHLLSLRKTHKRMFDSASSSDVTQQKKILSI
jgi:hypothetical protein